MPDKPEHVRCENCWFFSWYRKGALYDGECRRNAPSLVEGGGTDWTPLHKESWCGHFTDQKPYNFMTKDERDMRMQPAYYCTGIGDG